jgi:hypothetical protein
MVGSQGLELVKGSTAECWLDKKANMPIFQHRIEGPIIISLETSETFILGLRARTDLFR